uniref:Uncharacterized protein n=1 Tax=Avena sativa TaxID=4498 RepID=A0ACD5VE39_AVESA
MPRTCWFLVSASLWWLQLMPVAAEQQRQGEGCSAEPCGNLTISYPFWTTDIETGRSCGSPDYQLTFLNNTPILRGYGFTGFAIISITYEERSMRAIDLGKQELIKASNSCYDPNWNTSAKLPPPLHISPSNLDLILYNCTGEAARQDGGALMKTRVRCGNESEVFVRVGGGHNDTSGNAGYSVQGCDAIVVPVLGSSSGEANATEYEQLINSGFLLTWDDPPPLPPLPREKDISRKSIKMGIGFGAGTVGMLIGLAAFFVWYKRKKRKQARTSSELMRSGSSMQSSYSKDLELGGSPHIFTFEELEVATDGFSASRELGDGGFGTVYKGKLKDGRVVAVKRLYKNNYKRVEQFLNEVHILSRLLHQNLVILYGCTSRMSRDLLLVYEFIPNGTVADHLHGSRAAQRGLTWPLRLNIAIETAEALAYLHAVEIIHRDVKTTNILLDNSFHVKVADFGLSRLFPLEVTHVSTVPQGTPGYVDPVYHQCYKLTDKSDVYSFGVVLVELISSKPAVDMSRSHSEINLANMALNRIQNHELVQLVDPELGYDTDSETRNSIDRVAEVAFQCLQLERELRPSIKEVVEVLNCIRDGDCPGKNMSKKTSLKEDTHLLKHSLQYSPDSVIHRFHSQSTNHSVASNASGV